MEMRRKVAFSSFRSFGGVFVYLFVCCWGFLLFDWLVFHSREGFSVALAILDQAGFIQRFTCLCLLSARIKGVCHHHPAIEKFNTDKNNLFAR